MKFPIHQSFEVLMGYIDRGDTFVILLSCGGYGMKFPIHQSNGIYIFFFLLASEGTAVTLARGDNTVIKNILF